MSVSNPTGTDAVKSKATAEDLAAAMTALHLEHIPPEKRLHAIREQMAKVMLSTVTDPKEMAKPAYQEVKKAFFRSRGVILGPNTHIVL
jgi:hypothetical protein